MSIANELSCDVAAAVFASQAERSEPDIEHLTQVILTLHTTLRQMTSEARARRRAQLADRRQPAASAHTASH